MLCRHCGTEIADKALICYRCGAGTSDPVRKPAGTTSRRPSPIWSFLAVLALTITGLYLGQVQTGEVPPYVSWILVGLAVILLIWTLLRRRPWRR